MGPPARRVHPGGAGRGQDGLTGGAARGAALGFVKKTDIPLGEHRWLTVVSREAPDGVELLLEPDEQSGGQAL
jgi:hypothetical protein